MAEPIFLVAGQPGTSAGSGRLVTAGARGLLDLRGNVLNTARAAGHGQAATGRLFLTILELGFKVLLLGLRLHILHTTRARLEMQAAAGILDELEVARTARAVTSRLETGAEHV